MSSVKMQPRIRNISFSSTVSAQFTILSALSDKLAQGAQDYWKSKGLVIKSLMRSDPGSSDVRSIGFVAEGGTIWTTDFDSYKKRISVNLSENYPETEFFVQLVLPGGLMSMEDREKAANLIESFYQAMKAYES